METTPVVQEMLAISGYRILKKIGQGGMGSVFMARQLFMDRIVALKLLPRRLSKDQEFVAALCARAVWRDA